MKDKIIVFSFMIYIILFSLLHIIINDNEISFEERRNLSTFPKYEFTSKFITNLEDYFLDQFPFRNRFRSVKANFNYNILLKLDNNNIYLKDNYIFKSIYPTNKKSIDNFKKNVIKIKNMFPESNNFYLMIIPDKNYYLEDKNFLKIDYEYIFNSLKELNIQTINIKDILSLSDYYETDTHWKQENLDKVIKKMSTVLNFNYQMFNYTKVIYNNFYGVYYGESAINRSPEIITYLTNNFIDNLEVKYLENKKLNNIYNKEKLTSFDSYEVFLDGASSFIEIKNNMIKNNKELIIFRDSFASSLIPLLTPYYSKITVIDNRYISSEYFFKNLDYENNDILFIYSTLIMNDSYSLKG